MKILLTGATGYIGERLFPVLADKGYQVCCIVRDKLRFPAQYKDYPGISVIEGDFLSNKGLYLIPEDIDIAYYLIHSMTGSVTHFEEDEQISARNFRIAIDKNILHIEATMRPKGLLGRLYWYSTLPLHKILFKKLGKELAQTISKK